MWGEGISVLIPTSGSFYKKRLEACLSSVANQTMDRRYINITLMCLEHEEKQGNLGGLVELAVKCNAAIVFYKHKKSFWPPSLSRNIGIRRAPSKLLAFVDADAVLHPQTFDTALQIIGSKKKAVRVPTKLMPYRAGHSVFNNLTVKRFEKNAVQGKEAKGPGCCIIARTEDVYAIHGWDEQYVGYGKADWDFVDRLKKSGVPVANLAKQRGIWSMHQDHDRKISQTTVAANRRIYAKIDGTKTPIRNRMSWGGMPSNKSSRKPVVTIVVPVSSPAMENRLRMCLSSIRQQRYPQVRVDIIVTYLHKNPREIPVSIANVCRDMKATLLFQRYDRNSPYLPALARNMGVRRGVGNVILFLDVDIVMHPYTIAKSVAMLKGRKIVLVGVAMVPREDEAYFTDLPVKVFEKRMMNGLIAGGTGACLFVPWNVVRISNVYDEKFRGYGATDWDFTERLPYLNVDVVKFTEATGIRAMHRAHGSRRASNPPSAKNRQYFKQMLGKEPKRNKTGWGGLPSKPYIPKRPKPRLRG